MSARRSFHVAVPNFLRRRRYVRKLIQKHSSGHVISGPFAGMQYVNTSVGSALEPKILGTYELELHDVFERLLDKDFAAIVNVGAGEGYLAVGLAMCFARTNIIAYEMQEKGRALIARMATINGVIDQIEIKGQCDVNSLAVDLSGSHNHLVVMDVEGAEDALLDPDRVPGLLHSHVVVETHDHVAPSIGATIRGRVQHSHNVTEILSRPRAIADFPVLVRPMMSWHLKKTLAAYMDERRAEKTAWLYLEPKSVSVKLDPTQPFRDATASASNQCSISSPKTVLFYRDFRHFTGGHLKVWHYYNHLKNSPNHVAKIFFSPQTWWNTFNPWLSERDTRLPTYQPEDADILFLAGNDWRILNDRQRQDPPKPVINLVQHVKHADPNNNRYGHLKNKAIRICISSEVAEAIEATRCVNGPVLSIPCGLDTAVFPTPRPWLVRNIDVLVVGWKQRKLARALTRRLRLSLMPQFMGRRIVKLAETIDRQRFLETLGDTKIALFLPNPTEGFFIPALEGMQMKALVICPDCVGNRSFCCDGYNCLRPSYTKWDILEAAKRAVVLRTSDRNRMLNAGCATAYAHTLNREREAFLSVLSRVDELWQC